MEWVEDSSLASRVLADIAAELDVGQQAYIAKLPHLSELNYCLTRSYLNRVDPLPSNEQETLLFSLGIGLEQVLLRPHRKPEYGEQDGIHWSADWLDYIDGLGELKTTRFSANKPMEDLPITWRRQVLGYMKAKEKREVSLAILHVMGNYAPPFPMLKCWHGTATVEEIEETWDWFLGRKVVYLDHLERKEMPRQFTFNEDWECTNCRYKLICQIRQSVEDRNESDSRVLPFRGE